MLANHTERTSSAAGARKHAFKRKKSEGCAIRRCNLCNEKFLALSRFERFCLTCKEEDELYHYHETLPSLSEHLVTGGLVR